MFMSLLPEIIAGLMLTSSGALAIAKREEIMDKIKRIRIPVELEEDEAVVTSKSLIDKYMNNHANLRMVFSMALKQDDVLMHYKKQPITVKQYLDTFEEWSSMLKDDYDFMENGNRHFFSVFIPETRAFFAVFTQLMRMDPTREYISKADKSFHHVYFPGAPGLLDFIIDKREIRAFVNQYQKVFGMMYHFHSQQVDMVKDRNKNSLDQISISMENTFSYVASNGDTYGYEIEEGLFEEIPMIETEKLEEVLLEEEEFLSPSIRETSDFIERHGQILQSEMQHYRDIYEYEGISFKNTTDTSSRAEQSFHYVLVGDFKASYQPGNQSYPQLKAIRRMHVMTDSFSKPGDARPYKMVTINNYQPSQLKIHDSEFFFHYVKEKLPSSLSTYTGPAHLRHLHHAKYVVFFRDSLFYGNFEQIKEMLELYFINPKEEYFRDLPASELRFLKQEMGIAENHIFYRSN